MKTVRLFSFVMLLAVCQRSNAAIAFVAGGTANGNAATSTSVTISPTGGTGHDILCGVALATSSATVSSITATGGTATFRKIKAQVNTGNEELWAAKDIGSGITSLTVNFGSSKFSIACGEYSGIATWRVVANKTGSTSPAAITATTVKTGTYLVMASGLFATASTWSAGTNSTVDANGGNASQSGSTSTKCSGALTRNTSTTASDLLQITLNANESANSAWAAVALELSPTADATSGRVVQATSGMMSSTDTMNGNTTSLALRSAVTSANLLVGCSHDHSTSSQFIHSDTDGNTYSNAVAFQDDSGGTFTARLVYAANTVAGSSTQWNVVSGPANGPASFFVMELNSAKTTSPLDKTASANGSSTAPSSGATSATTQSNELVLGCVGSETALGSITAGSGFTLQQSNGQSGDETKTVTSTGAQTATFTLGATGSWAAIVATFIDASQPAGSCNHALPLLGAGCS